MDTNHLQALHKLMIGESTPEMVQFDLKLEQISQATVEEGIAACTEAGGYISREVFKKIFDDTEEHIDQAAINYLTKTDLRRAKSCSGI